MRQEDTTKKFSGEWLLLFNDEVIDHSSNVEDILKLAEEKFPADKFPDDEIKISKVLDGSLRELWFIRSYNLSYFHRVWNEIYSPFLVKILLSD